MKRSITLGAVLCLGSVLSSTQASLTPILGPSSDGNPPGTLVDVMHTLVGAGFDATAAANRVDDSADQLWTSNGTQTSTLLLEIAGNKDGNKFGLYNLSDPSKKLEIFSGPNSAVLSETVNFSGATATLGASSVVIGTDFGFYLSGPGGTFYSRQSDNVGGYDQMVTLKTGINRSLATTPTQTWKAGEYLLAFEDLVLNTSDHDYQDMIVKVDARPVPEPTTVIAGAILLLPFGMSFLRTIRKKAVA